MQSHPKIRNQPRQWKRILGFAFGNFEMKSKLEGRIGIFGLHAIFPLSRGENCRQTLPLLRSGTPRTGNPKLSSKTKQKLSRYYVTPWRPVASQIWTKTRKELTGTLSMPGMIFETRNPIFVANGKTTHQAWSIPPRACSTPK